ncbi:MAG: GTPase domain-containing protein [Desulfomonile tiedjei]|uniref:GTPase domain-containing protein n=1 Tax=Desulfomonile tiedjei TaxID=2358 RepID=A0A9D6Z3D5_9BACT|nr:GTPase domain-containing protein [Desulfomonile tiedjei]
MPHINYRDKQLSFKIVYYGPGLSGKTTNLMYIHQALEKDRRGDIVVLDTAEERTLFFDFFPLELGRIEGYSVHFNMYTVPGQVYYEASRRLILEGADGVVFVADSHEGRMADNVESFCMLQTNLTSFGLDWQRFPLVLQYNKRDLVEVLPLGTLERELGLNGIPVLEAVATAGTGVMETIRTVSRHVIQKFQL